MEGVFDCSRCQTEPSLKQILGCTEELPSGRRFNIGGVELSRCPRALLNEQGLPIADLFLHWRMWLSGLLPNTGSYLDQPARFVDAMVLLDQLWLEYRLDKEREQERRLQQLSGQVQTLSVRR